MITMSPKRAPARALGAFADLMARVSGWDSDSVRARAASMLGVPSIDAARAGISTLNHDASPLELCLTARTNGHAWRIIADPGFERLIPEQRLDDAKRALSQLLADQRCESLIPAIERMLAASLTPGPKAFGSGAFWLASGIGGGGVGVYVDASPHADAWGVARQLAGSDEALAAIDALARTAAVSSFAIEGSTLANARLKIYFRLREPAALEAWGLRAFADPRYLEFLTLVLRDAEVRREGIVASVGFALADGAATDTKIDVCAHCLPWDATAWRAIVATLAATFEVRVPPIDDVYEVAPVAFIGLGLDVGGDPRLNVYFKPREETADAIERLRIRTAWRLLRTRRADGSWSDYALPVGASDQWVTAYAGHALAIAGRSLADARTAAHEAAEWLQQNRTCEAGWGFNGITGPDADSTAFALALRRELGLPVEEHDLRFLLACRTGGGYATYPREDAWGVAHADVTPLAFRVMPDEVRSKTANELIAFLRASRLTSGAWPSYWWRSDAYSSWAVGALLAELGRTGEFERPPIAPDPASAFDLACAAGVACAWGDVSAAHSFIDRLAALEMRGGGFEGEAQLRVVDRDDLAPWHHARSHFYRDQGGTIVNATVLRALSLFV